MRVLIISKTALLSLYQSVKRFPATIFLTTATTILLIILTRIDGDEPAETLLRLAMTTALGVPLSLSIALAYERQKSKRIVEYGYVLALVFLAFYYFFLFPDFGMVAIDFTSMTRYIAVSAAMYLAFLFVPYFFRRPGLELYVIRVLTRALVTAVYSAVLFAGLAVTLLTIDLLLGIEVSEIFYSNVGLAVAGIFAPCFLLAGLPAPDQDMEQESYPNLLKVLFLYIVMPIILTYTLILYIYFLKTLLTLEWPEGTVSHLVLWYSVFSAGVIFLISPLAPDNKFVRFFTAWFPRLVLPALAVMFMAIAIRINAYGVTENRYFVVALGLWVFGVMLYYSLTARFKNIVLPVSLALVAILAVSGPWSAYTVSKYSQNQRFEALAAEYNMVSGDTLQPPNQEITQEDKKEIVSILDYFSRFHKLEDVRLLPPGFTFANMEQVFGFSREDAWMHPNPARLDSFRLSSQVKTLDIQGYDFMTDSTALTRESITVGALTVRYLQDELKLVVLRGDQEVYSRKLQTYAEEVVERHGAYFLEVQARSMTFVDENEEVGIKLVFTDIYGKKTPVGEWTEIEFKSFAFLLLVHDMN